MLQGVVWLVGIIRVQREYLEEVVLLYNLVIFAYIYKSAMYR